MSHNSHVARDKTGGTLYRLAPMSTDANRSLAVACRRLVAALCVFVLLAGLLSVHAGAQAALAGFDQTPVSAVEPARDGEADRGAAPDAVPCHAACHCTCKIAVLPDAATRRTSSLVRPAAFSAAPSHALRPGLLAPPSEPPRT